MRNEFLYFLRHDSSDSLATLTGATLGKIGILEIVSNVHYFIHKT